MGLTGASTGPVCFLTAGYIKKRKNPRDRIVALAGNPNLGEKHGVQPFDRLKPAHRGTGPENGGKRPGKVSAQGSSLLLVDIPGTYSLMANSAEEKIARDFICFGGPTP